MTNNMKFLVLLVFCFGVKENYSQTCLTNSCGIEKTSKTYDVGLKDNEDDVTNNNNIIEPCEYADYDCMRQFMAKNSNCKPAYGPVPDPIYISQSTIYFPNSNFTFTFMKLTVAGLSDASIVSFYYNKKTKNLLLAIKISALAFEIPKVFITYRRPGLESISKSDYANATFESLTFTATIPKVGGKFRFDLLDAKHGYVGEAYPDFYIGPEAYTSTDPIVTAAYASFLENIPLDVKTTFLFYSELFTALYIQTNICDFGAKLYSV